MTEVSIRIFLSALLSNSRSSGTVYYLFTLGSFFMDFARFPKLRELRVSCSLMKAGEIFIISFVTEFPPKLY